MGAWTSFAAGWRSYWTCRGVVLLATLNFAVNLGISLVLGMVMAVAAVAFSLSRPRGLSPHYQIISFPSNSVPFPGPPPFYRPPGPWGSLFPTSPAPGLMVVGGFVFLVFIAMSSFISAATPGSLLAALRQEFSAAGYFAQGRSYFFRAFGLFWFELALGLVLMALSALIVVLCHMAGGVPGMLAAGAVIVLGLIFAAGVFLIARLNYLTDVKRSLAACLGQAAVLVHRRYWSWLALVLLMSVFLLLVGAFSFLLFIVPLLGPLIMTFFSFSVLNIIYVAVISFTGLAYGST